MFGGGSELAAVISEVSMAVTNENVMIPTIIHPIDNNLPASDFGVLSP